MSQICNIGTDCWELFSTVEEEEKKLEPTQSEETKTWNDERFTRIVIQDDGETEEVLSGYVTHLPSGDQYGHRNGADSDLTIRMKMVFLFFTTPLVGTFFAIPLRVAHLCSGHWAIGQGYSEALSQWKIERLNCYDNGQLDEAPSRFDLYTNVALKSIKYFAQAFIKLVTYPLALALCVGATLIAPVSPFWARHVFARIQEAWSIDLHPQSRFALGVNHLMNFQAPCMLSKRIWEEYNLYERGFDEKEPLDQIYNLKQQILRFSVYFPEKKESWVKILNDLRNLESSQAALLLKTEIEIEQFASKDGKSEDIASLIESRDHLQKEKLLHATLLIKTQKEIEQFVSKMDQLIDETIDQEPLSNMMNREEELQYLQNRFDHFALLNEHHELEINKAKNVEAIENALKQIEQVLDDIPQDLKNIQGKGSLGEEVAHRLETIRKELAKYAADKSFENAFQRVDAVSERLAYLQSIYELHLKTLQDADLKYEASLKEEELQPEDFLYPGGPVIHRQKKDGNCWLNMILNGLKHLNRDPGVSQEILRSWTVDWMVHNYARDQTLKEYIDEAILTHQEVGKNRLDKMKENIQQSYKAKIITKNQGIEALKALRNEEKALDKFSLQNYWELMRKNGSFGTRAELYALSRIFSVNIDIWRMRNDGLGLTNEYDPPITAPHYRGTIGAVMNELGNHFDLLGQPPQASHPGESSES